MFKTHPVFWTFPLKRFALCNLFCGCTGGIHHDACFPAPISGHCLSLTAPRREISESPKESPLLTLVQIAVLKPCAITYTLLQEHVRSGGLCKCGSVENPFLANSSWFLGMCFNKMLSKLSPKSKSAKLGKCK